MTVRTRLRLDVFDDHLLDLLSAWGVPYSWGAGRPTVTGWPEGVAGLHGGVGYDCSGFAQAALVRLGRLPDGGQDRSAAALFSMAVPLPNGDVPRLGDLAFYGKPGRIVHVMVCLGGGAVIGASGGGSGTNGDDPKAFVQLHRLNYRNDLVEVRRIS